MIVGLALSLVAWAVAGAAAWPVDAFLPVAVALGARRDVAVDARLATSVLLGALVAAAAGQPPLELAAVYAFTTVATGRVMAIVRDRATSRALSAGVGLGGAVLAQHALAALHVVPAPGTSAAAVGWTVAWTAVHAVVSHRVPFRPSPARHAGTSS